MSKPWSQVALSPEFQALSPDDQETARRQYFDDVVAPQVGESDLEAARSQFDADTRNPRRPLPAGVKPSTGGPGRSTITDPRAFMPPAPATRAVDVGYSEVPQYDEMPPAPAPAKGGSVLDRAPDPNLSFADYSRQALATQKRVDQARASQPLPTMQAATPGVSERVGSAVADVTKSAAGGDLARRAVDTALLAPEAAATGLKLVSDIGNLATLGAAQPVSDWLEKTTQAIQANKSTRYRTQAAELGQLMKSNDAGVVDVVEFLAANPGFAAELGVPSLPSMLVGAGGGRALGAINAAAAARRGASAAEVASAFRTGAAAGSGLANAAMNAGDTFSETDGDVVQKLTAAGAAAAGTAVAGRVFEGGAEKALAAGAKRGIGSVAGIAGREAGQEAAEAFSQQLGKGTAEGNFDLGQAGKQATLEGALGGLTGAGAGLVASRMQQPGEAPVPTSSDYARLVEKKGLLGSTAATTPHAYVEPENSVGRQAGLTPIVVPGLNPAVAAAAVEEAPAVDPTSRQPGQLPDFGSALARVDDRIRSEIEPEEDVSTRSLGSEARGLPLHQAGEPLLQGVRGAGDIGSSVVDGSRGVREVPSGTGPATSRNDLGSNRDGRQLRAGELPMGNPSAAGGQPTVLSDRGGRGSENDDSRGGAPGWSPRYDSTAKNPQRDSGERGSVEGPASTSDRLKVFDARRRDAQRAGVGESAGDQSANSSRADTQRSSPGEGAGDRSFAIEEAAKQAASSPHNDLTEPTDAQKSAGNYRLGHVRFDGLNISIETPKGAERRSKADAPEPWQVTMPAHYGYIKGTVGSDGDHADIFIGDAGNNGRYWVINQDHAEGSGKTGHDEHKIVTGVDSAEAAVNLYKKSFANNFGDRVYSSISTEFDAAGIKAALPSMAKPQPVLAGNVETGDGTATASQGVDPGAGPRSAAGGRGDGVWPADELRAGQPQGGQPGGAAALGGPSAVVDPAVFAEDLRVVEDQRLRRGEVVKLEAAAPADPVLQRLASAIRAPINFVRVASGKASFAGWARNGRVYVNVDSAEAPLAVAMHEGVHTMPDEIKRELIKRVMATVSPKQREMFLVKYSSYSTAPAAKQDEELTAMLAQEEAKKPAFWEELGGKLGDGEFAKLAKHILRTLDTLLAKVDPRGDDVFTSDIRAVRSALTDAYAKVMKGQTKWDGEEFDAPESAGVDVVEGEDVSYSEERGRRETIGDYQARAFKDGSLLIEGDHEVIRAALPDDVVGRVTDKGVRYTTSQAQRVRAVLEGRDVAYSRAGQVLERLPMKSGKYLGAPAKFDTPAKIPTLRKWLRQLADEGAPGRFWYERSSAAVLKFTGGDVREARKFVAVLAIYSPQAKVDTNSTFALRAWAQYKAGKPIKVKTGVMDEKAKKALDDVDAFWSGEKTGNFFFNLLREIDPSTEGKQGATIDMWMMRAGQYDNDAPTKTQYAFMENETNRIADELGWEPQQVQAAIWVAMKARMENAGVKKRTEATSEKKGWITYTYPIKNGKAVKTREVLDKQAHRDNWLKHAFAFNPGERDTSAAKFDFEDGIRRHIGQVSWEARPSRVSGVLPGVNDAPYAQQVEFQQAVQMALHDDGGDMLAKYLGLLADDDILAPGAWQGEISAGMQIPMAMAPGEKSAKAVDPAQAKLLNIYAATLGLVLKQDGLGWHRPFYAATKKASNGLDIRIGRPLSEIEMRDLNEIISKKMVADGKPDWQNGMALVSAPTGVRIISFGALSNQELQSKEFAETIEAVLPDGDILTFASDGDMPTNDWTKDRNGQAYASRISAEGRPDVLDWARTVLAPRVQRVFDEYSRKYDWGSPGSVDFSEAPATAEPQRLQEPGGVRRSPELLAGARRPDPGAGRATTLDGLPRLIPVDGKVVEFGGFAPAQAAARAYMRQAGLPYSPPTRYAKVDPARASRIAREFTMLKHDPSDPMVRRAYQAMIAETRAQYESIIDTTGLEVEFIDYARTGDPYGNPRNAILDVVRNNHLWVFSTRDGFGSDEAFDPAANPLLGDTGIVISGQPALANDLFRVVHDYFGHIKEGVGFRAEGEENAWRAHSSMYSPLARRAMTTETRGQNSWVNFGPKADQNKTAGPGDTVYADQKVGLLPAWVSEDGAVDFSEAPRQTDMFSGEFANKRTSVSTDIVIDSKGNTAKGGNVNSAGQQIAATKQSLQNFWDWFGASEVQDDRGRPLVLYHSTNSDISEFEVGRATTNNYGFLGNVDVRRGGIFMTPDKTFSQEYLRDGSGQNVMPVYASLKNPLDLREGLSASDYRELEDAGISTRYILNAQSYWELFDLDDDGNSDFIDGLKKAGYDGAIFREDSPGGESQGGTTYMAFSPSQVKSALGNRGTFKAESDDIAFSESPTWYSAFSRAIDKGPGQAMPDQWRAFIKGLTTKGVKPDEIEWSGVNEWLQLQTGKVGRDQVKAFLSDNGIRVEETVLGSQAAVLDGMRAAIDGADFLGFDSRLQAMGALRRDFNRTADADKVLDQYDLNDGERAALKAWLEANDLDEDKTKYGQYTLPGGTNYREVLLTLPEPEPDFRVDDFIDAMVEKYGKAAIYDTEGNYSKIKADFPAMLSKEDQARYQAELKATKPRPTPYTHGHWNGHKNVLAHLRVNDRESADGKRVLFVEELQSDFGQDMKKQRAAVGKAVDADFEGIVERMKRSGVLTVECD